MQEVKAISLKDVNFKTLFEDGKFVVADATKIVTLWGETANEGSLSARYAKFALLLAEKWGRDITDGTAYMVLEKAVEIVNLLKKTHFYLPSLKSSDSTPEVAPTQN